MSLLAKLKGQEQPITAAINDDLISVDDPARGAPIRAPAGRPSFKPVNPASAEIVQDEHGQDIIVLKTIPFRKHDAEHVAHLAKKRPVANPSPPRDDFLDLIMDDPPPSSGLPSAGRPRVYANNAERQQAYRDRKKRERGR